MSLAACWFVDSATIGLQFDGPIQADENNYADFAATGPVVDAAGLTVLVDAEVGSLLAIFTTTALTGDPSETFTATLRAKLWTLTGTMPGTPDEWSYFGTPPESLLLAARDLVNKRAEQGVLQ